MSTLSYKHSGTLGDLIYSLPIVQHFGGGEFYLHLGQIDWIGQHYYGAKPQGFHQGRMTPKDFEFMQSFMKAQKYITKFEPMDPRTTAVTHNLDRFRVPFVGHPGNYVDIYADVFGINDAETKELLRGTQWITVPETKTVEGRDIAINRTGRWLPPTLSPLWKDWQSQGLEQRAFFLGLADEHAAFQQATGWTIPHQKTTTLLDVAEHIAGSKVFIGNQSVALSVAIGLGHNDVWCEARRDLEITRNECYFPKWEGLHYF